MILPEAPLGKLMPIYRLLKNMPMGPEEISRLTTAYEQALRKIGIADRGDSMAEWIAKKIIEVAQTGVHEPAEVSSNQGNQHRNLRPVLYARRAPAAPLRPF